MNYGPDGRRKFDVAATLAVSLASVLLRQRDSVGLATAGTAIREELRPVARCRSSPSSTTHSPPLSRTAKRIWGVLSPRIAERIPRRGLVVIVSDLLTDLERLYESLGRLQFGGHAIVLLHVLHRDELEMRLTTR